MENLNEWLGGLGRSIAKNPGWWCAAWVCGVLLLTVPLAHSVEVRAGAAPAPGASAVVASHPAPFVPVVPGGVAVLPVAVRVVEGVAEKAAAAAAVPVVVVPGGVERPSAVVRSGRWPTYAGLSAPRLRPCVGVRGHYSDTCAHEK